MEAHFIAASGSVSSFPEPNLMEIAVAGRSNCGKSSLINAVTGQKKLARTSSTPGRTQQIIFFHIRLQGSPPFSLVDLPGYGYAKTSIAQKNAWAKVINHYIEKRITLRHLLLLIDIRRNVGDEEKNLLQWLKTREIAPLCVLTKSDKLNKSQQFNAQKRVRQSLGLPADPYIFSIRDPQSVERMRAHLVKLANQGHSSPLAT